MFYLGIYFHEAAGPASLFILKKKFKNAKKHYYVKEIRAYCPPADIEKTICSIETIFHDRKYSKTKRVFRQHNRPARIVLAPPIVVAGSDRETGKIDQLRKRKIPVEGVFLQDGNGWRKEDYHQICLGDNYFVAASDIMDSLVNVYVQNRLILETDIAFADFLRKTLDGCSEDVLKNVNTSGLSPPMVHAKKVLFPLAIPVWFCEKIKTVKRY